MKIFVICQVRKADKDEISRQKLHVEFYERLGHEVYWPNRDTDQMDPTGLAICEDHFHNMQKSDLVHVMWTDGSEGTRFDLGMAFAMGKPIIPFYTTLPYLGKSYPAIILHYFDKYGFVGAQLPRLSEVLRANHQKTQILPDEENTTNEISDFLKSHGEQEKEEPYYTKTQEPYPRSFNEISDFLKSHGMHKFSISLPSVSEENPEIKVSTETRLGAGEQEHIQHMAKGYRVQFRIMPDEQEEGAC